jgi:hypothetical protein
VSDYPHWSTSVDGAHGRAWLHLSERHAVIAEWTLGRRRSLAASVKVDGGGEGTVLLHASIPGLSIFLGLDSWPLGGWMNELAGALGLKREDDWGTFRRELSIRVFDWAVWWRLWRNPDHRYSRDSRDGAWHPFGHPGSCVGKAVVREQRTVIVPLPERSYRAQATRSDVTIRDERLPLLRRTVSIVELKFEKGDEVPVPGKGENSWDIDDDATYSTSGPHKSIEAAIGACVGRTLETRAKRAGADWRPTETSKGDAPTQLGATHR